jgi:uncharacterized repeat protein (TIGR04052 family)
MLRRSLLVLSIGAAACLQTQSMVTAQVAGPQCVGDSNADFSVTVDEVVTAVDNVLNGCDSEQVSIQFNPVVGDEPFACGTAYQGLGLSGEQVIPADFRLYIHNVRLIDDLGRQVPVALVQDGIWQLEDLVLLDFEDKTPPCNLGTAQTHMAVHGVVPPGNYKGIRFALGVPFRLNHQDTATARSPLTLSAMFWNWQGGYKFLRIDEALDVVRVHLGSTGCVAVSPTKVSHCERPNVGEIYLPMFDPTVDLIDVDLAALLSDSDLGINDPDTAPGCESSPDDGDCGPLLQNLGVNFDNGLPDASRQKLFRVEHPGEES